MNYFSCAEFRYLLILGNIYFAFGQNYAFYQISNVHSLLLFQTKIKSFFFHRVKRLMLLELKKINGIVLSCLVT